MCPALGFLEKAGWATFDCVKFTNLDCIDRQRNLFNRSQFSRRAHVFNLDDVWGFSCLKCVGWVRPRMGFAHALPRRVKNLARMLDRDTGDITVAVGEGEVGTCFFAHRMLPRPLLLAIRPSRLRPPRATMWDLANKNAPAQDCTTYRVHGVLFAAASDVFEKLLCVLAVFARARGLGVGVGGAYSAQDESRRAYAVTTAWRCAPPHGIAVFFA